MDPFAVLGVDPIPERFYRWWAFARIYSINSERLVRPIDHLLAIWIESPTARMGQPLRFGQIRFTLPQGLLDLLSLSNIHRDTDESDQIPTRASDGVPNCIQIFDRPGR